MSTRPYVITAVHALTALCTSLTANAGLTSLAVRVAGKLSTKLIVPPTPYYYGKRADLFLRNAHKALAQGNKPEYERNLLKAIEYRELAGQFPLERTLCPNN